MGKPRGHWIYWVMEDPMRQVIKIILALRSLPWQKNEARLAIASLSIIDLMKDEVSSRAQLDEEWRKEQMAQSRLQKATSSWLYLSSSGSVVESTCHDGSALGRITLPCRDGV